MTARMEEVYALMRGLESEPGHVIQVARLADSLFNQLAWLPQIGSLPSGCRERLEAAALLHDIGWTISPGGSGHHKASAQMIMENPWIGWGMGEIQLIAQIARYHRKSLPSLEHEGFAALDEEGRCEVVMMASLLRMADALDRRHLGRTGALQVDVDDKSITVLLLPVYPEDPLDTEIAAARKKSDLAELGLARRFLFARQGSPSDPAVTGFHSP